jgi:hypothetical protein
MTPTLSILTPTIPARESLLAALSAEIMTQIEEGGFHGQVEHLSFSDNRTRSIGAKRQALVDIARGEYIAFVDDDDTIGPDYVEKLLAAAKAKPDVITFRQEVTYNGAVGIVEFGLNHHDHPFKPGEVTHRAPWHVCAWKREKVHTCQFGETNYGEDIIWCLQARRRIASGIHIDAILQHYVHDTSTTAAPEPT